MSMHRPKSPRGGVEVPCGMALFTPLGGTLQGCFNPPLAMLPGSAVNGGARSSKNSRRENWQDIILALACLPSFEVLPCCAYEKEGEPGTKLRLVGFKIQVCFPSQKGEKELKKKPRGP